MTRIEEFKRNLRALAKRKGHALGPFRLDEHRRALAPAQMTWSSRCEVCKVLVILNEGELWLSHNDRALSQRCLTSKNLHYSTVKEKSRAKD